MGNPKPTTTPERQRLHPETRALLDAVREALDIPYASTNGHDKTRQKILDERLMHLMVTVSTLADHGTAADLPHSLEYLRERLAEHPPIGYITTAQARQRLQQGADWNEAVTLGPIPLRTEEAVR